MCRLLLRDGEWKLQYCTRSLFRTAIEIRAPIREQRRPNGIILCPPSLHRVCQKWAELRAQIDTEDEQEGGELTAPIDIGGMMRLPDPTESETREFRLGQYDPPLPMGRAPDANDEQACRWAVDLSDGAEYLLVPRPIAHEWTTILREQEAPPIELQEVLVLIEFSTVKCAISDTQRLKSEWIRLWMLVRKAQRKGTGPDDWRKACERAAAITGVIAATSESEERAENQ